MDLLTLGQQHGGRAPSVTVGPFKVVLLGNAGVGKTSILEQYVNRSFTVDFKSSIGVDFFSASHRVGGTGTPSAAKHAGRHPRPPPEHGPSETIVDLQLWDTAGQERYRGLSRAFYHGARAAVFVFDATDVECSLTAALKWYDDMVEITGGAAGVKAILFVANKIDLVAAAAPAADAATEGQTAAESHAATPRSRPPASVAASENIPPSRVSVPPATRSEAPSTTMSAQRPPTQIQLVVKRARAILDSRPDTSQLPVMACSAKFGTGIGDVFEHVAHQVSFQEEDSAPASHATTVSLSKGDSDSPGNGGRCSRC